MNVYAGSAPVASVNFELRTSDGKPQVAETAFDSSPDTQGTLPTTFNGYLLVGNDNYVSDTDQGVEIYYTKHTVSWVNNGDPHGGTFQVYNESGITWYGYDAGTLETTLNVSMSSGATYARAELEFEAGENAIIGNPDFNKIGVFFNCTNATLSNKVKEIRPKTGWYTTTDSVPEFLSGKALVGGIYVLKSDAIVSDYGTYRFPIVITAEAGQDLAPGEICYAHILDWSYYKDDNNKVQSGWEDQSDIVADTDVGIDTFAYAKAIAFS